MKLFGLRASDLRRAEILAFAIGFAIGFLPLAGGPGYEASFLLGLFVPSLTAVVVALRLSGSGRLAPLDLVTRGLVFGASFAGLAFAGNAVHVIWRGACDFVSGTIYFILTSGSGVVLAGLYGVVVAEFARRYRRRRLVAVLAGIGGPLGCALVSVYRFYAAPMIFAYDPFVGFFSGSLYDTVIDPGVPLYTYRVGTVCTVLGAWILASASKLREGASVGGGTQGTVFVLRDGSASTVVRAGLAALLFGANVAMMLSPASLGHAYTATEVSHELGARRDGPRCSVVYPRTVREEDARLYLKDCEEDLAEVEARLGARGPERVTAFFFRDSEEKRRLMGAAHTLIAKPWRAEVYVQVSAYPHPILGHELAHIVAGSFGRGPFRIAGEAGGILPNPGLIEGIAVAGSPDDGALTDFEWARTMNDEGILPKMKDVLSLSFFGSSAQKSYTVAGAFIGWCLDRYGSEPVRAWYGGKPPEQAFGKSLDDLDREFREALLGVALSPEAQAVVRARFERPSVFGRKCPHEIDKLRVRADQARDGHDYGEARGLYRKILECDAHDNGVQRELALLDLRTGRRVEGRARLLAIEADEALPRTTRDHAKESLADDDARAGRWDAAFVRYEDLERRAVDEDQKRNFAVKALGARTEALHAPVRELLLGEPDRAPDPFLFGLALGGADPEVLPLARYLVARQLATRGLTTRALATLEATDMAGLPPLVKREAFRMRAVLACSLGDRVRRDALRDDVEAVFPGGGGRKAHVLRLLTRCAN